MRNKIIATLALAAALLAATMLPAIHPAGTRGRQGTEGPVLERHRQAAPRQPGRETSDAFSGGVMYQ